MNIRQLSTTLQQLYQTGNEVRVNLIVLIFVEKQKVSYIVLYELVWQISETFVTEIFKAMPTKLNLLIANLTFDLMPEKKLFNFNLRRTSTMPSSLATCLPLGI